MNFFLAVAKILVIIICVSTLVMLGFRVLRRFSIKQDKSSKKQDIDAQQSSRCIELDKKALSQFSSSAFRMEGTLEAMYRLGNGHIENKDGVIFDWSSRIGSMPDAQHLRQVWGTVSNGFEHWTNDKSIQFAKKVSHEWVFKDGSFERDERDELIIEQSTCVEYAMDNGGELKPNSKALILWPCWKCKGNIIEKGMLKEVKE